VTGHFPNFGDDRFESHDGELDPVERRLRSALSAEADVIEPGHDGLRLIKERIAAGDRSGAPGPGARFMPLLAAAAAVLAAAGVTAGIISYQQQPPPPAARGSAGPTTPPASPTPTPPTSPTPTPAGSTTSSTTTTTTTTDEAVVVSPDGAQGPLPVYWLGEADGELHLYREFEPDPVAATDVPARVEAAVRRMLAGDPDDPDYSSPWRPAAVQVQVTRTQVTVDLGAEAFDGPEVDAATARAAVQQLVYTATAAAGTAEPPRTVKVLVDGRPGADAWGQVGLGRALSRSPAVLPEVWVIAPESGSRQKPGEVTVSGSGRGFEGLLRWEVTGGDGETVASDIVQGGATGIEPFSFTVELRPGRYTVAVWSPSPKDATDTRPFVDTKTFTVR
jgi:hypothetical protein